jgi:hypothetical protein
MWLPLAINSKKKTGNMELVKSIVLIEMDLLKLPSPLDQNPATYEDELEIIVKNM